MFTFTIVIIIIVVIGGAMTVVVFRLSCLSIITRPRLTTILVCCTHLNHLLKHSKKLSGFHFPPIPKLSTRALTLSHIGMSLVTATSVNTKLVGRFDGRLVPDAVSGKKSPLLPRDFLHQKHTSFKPLGHGVPLNIKINNITKECPIRYDGFEFCGIRLLPS